MRNEEKQKAIAMRREGKTYSEILKVVPVAKSTLSIWLRQVGLAKPQYQLITEKRKAAQRKGAQARRNQRITFSAEIFEKSEKEVGTISSRELWLMGTMLYWAEGSKEKEYYPGSGVEFVNSDPFMIKVFIKWLFNTFAPTREDFIFSIAIHKSYENRVEQVRKYWSEVTGFPIEHFKKVYYKRHNPKTNRKNIGNMYNGVLRVGIKASSTNLRRVTGWTRGVYNNICGIV